MGLFDFFRKKKDGMSLETVRREEIRLGIKESQTIAKLEKMEKEREDIFGKGAKIHSPSRRRQLARLYDMKSQGAKMLERELAVMSKEITTIQAVKFALERQKSNKEGVSKILQRVDEAELMGLLENDKVSQEMYLEKLSSVLSSVTESPLSGIENLGKEGNEVMDVWQKMDEGEIASFEDGLKLADKKVRQKQGEMEAEA